jgi:peptide/nickel transport system substrate-binding protein
LSADPRGSASPNGELLRRREALVALVGAALVLAPEAASARARLPLGGSVTIHAPWSLRTIDPHRLDDPGAIFFGSCLFDALYAIDGAGAAVPALAESLPEPSRGGVGVRLRRGVRFASGKGLTARDVASSLSRTRSMTAKGWLDPVGEVRVDATHGGLWLSGASPSRVARALASPLTAIVPTDFTPLEPDGTGAFASCAAGDGGRAFVRNRYAAMGPSFLDEVRVKVAGDLGESLRAFESGEDDLGWLGLGLHEPRRGAVPFDAGSYGWATLHTGNEAGRWNLPGVAQRLADGIAPSRLAQVGPPGEWAVQPDEGWGGPPTTMLVRDDSPWLEELAKAVAAALGRPDHEVTVRPLPPPEVAAARTSGAFALALDIVRPFDASPFGTYAALVAADDPVRGAERARRPPLGADAYAPRRVGRFLRTGVVSELRLTGGRMPDLPLPLWPDGRGIDFSSIVRPRPRVP